MNIEYRLGTRQDLDAISGECDEDYRNGQWKYDDQSAFVLHRFCVSPLFQNQGIGKAVLQHVEEQVKEMGYQSIRLCRETG